MLSFITQLARRMLLNALTVVDTKKNTTSRLKETFQFTEDGDRG